MQGLFYLGSMIAVGLVMWTVFQVEKSADKDAIHKGLLGVVRGPKPKKKRPKYSPWSAPPQDD